MQTCWTRAQRGHGPNAAPPRLPAGCLHAGPEAPHCHSLRDGEPGGSRVLSAGSLGPFSPAHPVSCGQAPPHGCPRAPSSQPVPGRTMALKDICVLPPGARDEVRRASWTVRLGARSSRRRPHQGGARWRRAHGPPISGHRGPREAEKARKRILCWGLQKEPASLTPWL